MHLTSHRIISAASIRSLAIEMASKSYWDPNTVSPRLVNISTLRVELEDEAEYLKSLHDELVHDTNPAHPSALLNAYQRDLLLNHACLRTSNSCLSQSHDFYTFTHSGLDALVSNYVDRAKALARGPLSKLVLGDQDFGFIWQIMPEDLMLGLNRSAQGVVEEDYQLQNVETVLEGVSLAAMIITFLFYYLRILRPFLKKTESESHRAAILIGFMPDIPEMDAFLARMKKIQRNTDFNSKNKRQSCKESVLACMRRRKNRNAAKVAPDTGRAITPPTTPAFPGAPRRLSDSGIGEAIVKGQSKSTVAFSNARSSGKLTGIGSKYRPRSQTMSPKGGGTGSSGVFNPIGEVHHTGSAKIIVTKDEASEGTQDRSRVNTESLDEKKMKLKSQDSFSGGKPRAAASMDEGKEGKDRVTIGSGKGDSAFLSEEEGDFEMDGFLGVSEGEMLDETSRPSQV